MNPKLNIMRVLQEYNRSFINWFRETIFLDDGASKTLRLLAVGPNLNVLTWKGYDINNYSFYTKSQDDKSSMQNNGVTINACRSKLHDESRLIQRCFDDNKDDDKGDDKKLKDQKHFMITKMMISRIKESRFKRKVEEHFKIQEEG